MSLLYYKFKSAKDFDTLPVDGSGLSVFDVKRGILRQRLDIDEHLGGEEWLCCFQPRSTSLIDLNPIRKIDILYSKIYLLTLISA